MAAHGAVAFGVGRRAPRLLQPLAPVALHASLARGRALRLGGAAGLGHRGRARGRGAGGGPDRGEERGVEGPGVIRADAEGAAPPVV